MGVSVHPEVPVRKSSSSPRLKGCFSCCDDCCEEKRKLTAYRLCNLTAPLCLNPMSPDHPAAGKSWIHWIWIQHDYKILSAKLEHEKVFLDSSVLSLKAEGQPVPDL